MQSENKNKKSCESCSAAAVTPPSSTVAGSVPEKTSNTQPFGTFQSPKGGSRRVKKTRRHRKHKKTRRVR